MRKMHVMHARRLLKLADFLETIPETRFDLRTWVGDSWKGKQDLSCGTTACALGWACTMPEFRKLGVRLKRGELKGPGIVGRRDSDAPAVAKHLFGIGDYDDEGSYETYYQLFFSSAYSTGIATKPVDVAARIRAVVAEQCPNAARPK